MATLTVVLPNDTHICNGKMITFRAPCDCTDDNTGTVITGIVIEGVTYELVGTNNECISNTGEMFSKGSMVSVVLDTENNKAYIQNAILAVVDSVESDSTTSALSANQGRVLKELIESKIIYSIEEPPVVEGAIWLKPRE